MGMISAVLGGLAILGHGCCCLPLISYVAPFVVVTLEVTALVTGFLARSQAAQQGGTDTMGTLGMVLAGVAMLMSVAYVFLVGGVVVAYLAAVIGLAVAGN